MRIRQALAAGLLALTPALTGCLVHTRSVLKTRPPDVVQNATLDQLLKQVDARYEAIQSMTFHDQVATTTGGSQQGEVKEYIPLNGYIIIGKPQQIRVFLELPYGAGNILDMVSDGKTFQMLIPHKNCAIVGSDQVTNTSQEGLYSLRPSVILDPLLIAGLRSGQVVSMTQDSRTFPDPKKRKGLIEEPDYDIEFLSQPKGEVASTLRVLHISRANLLPWRLDIYSADGKVETQASYSNYQKFGDIEFPTKIFIERKLDDLGLTITITKATFNQKLPDDQFKLDMPEGTAIQNMDDPASASTAPCVAHAPQSKH
jgi:outer membrane lipoprotein-sorting protein